MGKSSGRTGSPIISRSSSSISDMKTFFLRKCFRGIKSAYRERNASSFLLAAAVSVVFHAVLFVVPRLRALVSSLLMMLMTLCIERREGDDELIS